MKRLVPALLILTACANSTTSSTPPPVERSRSPAASETPEQLAATPQPKPKPKAAARCRYAFPVRPTEAADYGSGHHDYPATDIFAPEGADFVAPTDGRVDFVSRTDRWDPSTDDPATRGGLSIAIVGKDGIRYYGSHLREVAAGIKRGEDVRVGEKLGEIGNSGNARGVASHLHFGISRPSFPTDWKVRRGQVSPFDYLNAWRKGEDVTPEVPDARRPRCRANSEATPENQ
ncbi:MAG: peptidoglycan DD-metalloendopeptidase family protein [Actinomycetota bacterium]|nr:peptidoglycan DD-metalloendopeptidase family protein [Actinomycetota bacterium]